MDIVIWLYPFAKLETDQAESNLAKILCYFRCIKMYILYINLNIV